MSGSVASVASIDDLLALATEREPMKTPDSLSSATFEHVVIDPLVPSGDDPLPTEQHLRFCDHMAQLHASAWDWRDEVGLAQVPVRYTALGEGTAARERALGNVDGVPGMLDERWAALRLEAPEAGRIATRLAGGRIERS